jgi:hypothetical protein
VSRSGPRSRGEGSVCRSSRGGFRDWGGGSRGATSTKCLEWSLSMASAGVRWPSRAEVSRFVDLGKVRCLKTSTSKNRGVSKRRNPELRCQDSSYGLRPRRQISTLRQAAPPETGASATDRGTSPTAGHADPTFLGTSAGLAGEVRFDPTFCGTSAEAGWGGWNRLDVSWHVSGSGPGRYVEERAAQQG